MKPKEIIVEECERQFEFMQALKRTDFFKRDIGDKDSDNESKRSSRNNNNKKNRGRKRGDDGGEDEEYDDEEDDEFDSSFDGDYESWNDSATLSKETTSNDLKDTASQRRRGSESVSVGRSSGKLKKN